MNYIRETCGCCGEFGYRCVAIQDLTQVLSQVKVKVILFHLPREKFVLVIGKIPASVKHTTCHIKQTEISSHL